MNITSISNIFRFLLMFNQNISNSFQKCLTFTLFSAEIGGKLSGMLLGAGAGARTLAREKHYWGRPSGGSGGGAPPRTPQNFQKFSKENC